MHQFASASRSHSPTQSSTSVSINSSSLSDSSDEPSSTSASGSFAVGFHKNERGESIENGRDPKPLADERADNAPPANRPTCPQSVLWLIRGISFVMGAGGLGGMIYGGLGTSMPPDQPGLMERDKSMALMASSAVVMCIGMVAGMATVQRDAATTAPMNPA